MRGAVADLRGGFDRIAREVGAAEAHAGAGRDGGRRGDPAASCRNATHI